MILNKRDNLYTIYWLGGKREVVVGKTIEDAFRRAGYGGGASKAIDWYDRGATDTHVYSHAEKAWIIRPKRVSCADAEAITPQSIALELSKALGVDFKLPNKDQICIDVSIGHYTAGSWVKGLFGEEIDMGWARAIRIYLAEYRQGPYEDDGEEECHYSVSRTSWFDLKDIDQAIFHFQQTIKAHVNRNRGSMDLEAFRTFLASPAAGATSIQQLLETQPIHEL